MEDMSSTGFVTFLDLGTITSIASTPLTHKPNVSFVMDIWIYDEYWNILGYLLGTLMFMFVWLDDRNWLWKWHQNQGKSERAFFPSIYYIPTSHDKLLHIAFLFLDRDILWENCSEQEELNNRRTMYANAFLSLGAVLWSFPLATIQAISSAEQVGTFYWDSLDDWIVC